MPTATARKIKISLNLPIVMDLPENDRDKQTIFFLFVCSGIVFETTEPLENPRYVEGLYIHKQTMIPLYATPDEAIRWKNVNVSEVTSYKTVWSYFKQLYK